MNVLQLDSLKAQNWIFLWIWRRIDGFEGSLYGTRQQILGHGFVSPWSIFVLPAKIFIVEGVLKGFVQLKDQPTVLATHVYPGQRPHLTRQRSRGRSTHGNDN